MFPQQPVDVGLVGQGLDLGGVVGREDGLGLVQGAQCGTAALEVPTVVVRRAVGPGPFVAAERVVAGFIALPQGQPEFGE